jgi:hypothetical protein
MSDDAEVIRRLAVAEGIAYKSMLDVSDDIRAGRLRRCCRTIRAMWCR